MKKYSQYRYILSFLIIVFSFSFSILASGSEKSRNDAGDDTLGLEMSKAPNFTLPGLDKKIKLSELEGKIVYVDFWASWCGPCRKSFLWMNAMQDRYGSKGLKIVAINLDESRQDAKAFLDEYPADFSIAFDPDGYTAELYQVQGMPSSYLISSDGQIAYRHLGFRPADKRMLETAIEHLVSAL